MRTLIAENSIAFLAYYTSIILYSNSATPPRQVASMLNNARAARFHGPSNLGRGPVLHAIGIGLRLRPWVCELRNHQVSWPIWLNLNQTSSGMLQKHQFWLCWSLIAKAKTWVIGDIFPVGLPDLSTAAAAPLDTILAGRAPDAPHMQQG